MWRIKINSAVATYLFQASGWEDNVKQNSFCLNLQVYPHYCSTAICRLPCTAQGGTPPFTWWTRDRYTESKIDRHVLSCSVVSNSLWPHGLQPTRFLCPWDFPAKNTGVGCHFLLQGIFMIQELNPCLLHFLLWQADPLLLSLVGSPDR